MPVGRCPSLGLCLDPVPDGPRAPLLPLADLRAIKLPFRAAFEDISALLPLTFFVMINLLCSFCYIFSQLPNFDQLHKYHQQSIPKLQVYRCMEFLKVQ